MRANYFFRFLAQSYISVEWRIFVTSKRTVRDITQLFPVLIKENLA